MRVMTARKWNKGYEEYRRCQALASLQPLRESLFSSRINVLVRRVPATSKFDGVQALQEGRQINQLHRTTLVARQMQCHQATH